MTSQGRKRFGSSSNSQSKTQQAQMRQGSSFSSCPACGTSVHAALMSFHISSCPVVVSADESPVKKKHHRRERENKDETGEEGAHQSSGISEFSLVAPSTKNQEFLQKLGEEEEDVCEQQQQQGVDALESGVKLFTDPETPIREGRDRIAFRLQMLASPASPGGGARRDEGEGRRRLFEDWGQKLSPEPECAAVIGDDGAATSSVDPQSRRGGVMEAPFDEEASVVVDLGVLDSGSKKDIAEMETLPYLASIRDSQQQLLEKEDEETAFGQSKKIAQELGKNVGIQLVQGDGNRSLQMASQVQDGQVEVEGGEAAFGHIMKIAQDPRPNLGSQLLQFDADGSPNKVSENWDGKRAGNVVSHREVELECALEELREKYSRVLLRETELEQALQVKEEECQDVRRQEQEARNEVFSVRGKLETALQGLREVVRGLEENAPNVFRKFQRLRSHTAEDEECEALVTQLLSLTSNPPASGKCSPREVQDQVLTPRASSENLMTAHKLSQTDDEELATQLLSQGFNPESSPCVPESGQNSPLSAVHPQSLPAEVEFRGVSSPGTEPPDVPHGVSILSLANKLGKVDKCPVKRVFHGVTKMTGMQNADPYPSVRPLQSSQSAAALGLAPQSPGKALQPADGNEKSDSHEDCEEGSNATLYTVGHQRQQSTPSQPKTPQKFAITVGGKENNLISDVLDNFPPAQGTGAQSGIDPFDEAVSGSVWNVLDTSKDATPLQDVQTPVRDAGVEQELNHNTCQDAQNVATTASQVQCISGAPLSPNHRKEDALVQKRLKKKRRKPPLVVHSDSDAEIGDEEARPTMTTVAEDLRKGNTRRRLFRAKESFNDVEGIQPDPAVDVTKDTGTEVLRRIPRLRNSSTTKQTAVGQVDSEPDVGRRGIGLGTTGRCTRSQARALEDDLKEPDTDSESSDDRPTNVYQSRRKSGTAHSKRDSKVPRDPYGNKMEIDDDFDDDSSFINDDPESETDSGGKISTAGEESSETVDESDSHGSTSSKFSSDERKKYNWEFEGDMLAALAKDTDLCLRGLCALYRRQEVDEQQQSLTKYRNFRGFDKVRAARASNIASFLIGSCDASGPVKRTSAQLGSHLGQWAVTFCEDMCKHHSKQLFEIFKNCEDPYFPTA